MEIASARALKAELKSQVLPPLLAEAIKPQRLAVAATASKIALAHLAAAPMRQRTIALGIVPKGKGQAQLAIRVQRRALLPAAQHIAARAHGEAEIRYIGRVEKRQAAWYQTRQRPLAIGISVGHYSITAGTLGSFVRSAGAANANILSNNHVLANENRAKIGDAILQAGRYDGGRKPRDVVARLLNFIPLAAGEANLIDCAIATIVDGVDFEPQKIRGLGSLAGIAPNADEGIGVHKLGRTTGLTHGRVTAIELDNVVVAFDQGNFSFDNQIEIEGTGDLPFSDGGDSGSLVVDDGLHAVGLLFAGGDQGGGNGRGLTYANPIETVLAGLDAALLT
ncbi:MAG: hypothetical protein KIT16_10345 [Rhodospirillaceae bacterium]|nr:hypothetical protein [Rhodospirillaceae bacterium]